MNLRKLIDFFPYTYKERDTYKVNGQGILERFLEICGTYLEEYITPDIENELELIDLDKVPPMYLNYLWEYLGSIPFAYGVSIDKEKFDRYYNGLQSKEELEALSKIWTIQKKGPVVLNETKVRNILKYAITLTKIRGTKRFFETIFKLYGFECVVTDPTTGNTTSFNNWVDDKPIFDSEYYKFDTSRFDEDPRCSQCIPVTFDISCVLGFKDINGEYFYDSLGILFCGKYDGLLDLFSSIKDYNESGSGVPDEKYQEVIEGTTEVDNPEFTMVITDQEGRILYSVNKDYEVYKPDMTGYVAFNGLSLNKVINYIIGVHIQNDKSRYLKMSGTQEEWFQDNLISILEGETPASLKDFIAFRRMVEAFFDRYLPYNVIPHITYQGKEVEDDITITVDPIYTYDSRFPNTIFRGRKDYVSYSVQVNSKWSSTDKRYVISGNGVLWGEPHNLDSIDISRPGTYYIKPYDNNYKGQPVKIVVDEVLLNTWYSLLYRTPFGTNYTPSISVIPIDTKGIKHTEVLDDVKHIVQVDEVVPVIQILGKSEGQIQTADGYTRWFFSLADMTDITLEQRVSFGLSEMVNKNITFGLKRVPEYGFGSISPTTVAFAQKDNTLVTCYINTNFGYYNNRVFPNYIGAVSNTVIEGEYTRMLVDSEDHLLWAIKPDGTEYYPARGMVFTDGVLVDVLVNYYRGASDDELTGTYLPLYMKCRENGLIYFDDDQWKVNRDGVTHFEIERNFIGEAKHDSRVKAIILDNTVEHPTKSSFSVVRTTPLVVYIQSYKDMYALTDVNPTAEVYCYVNYYGTLPAGTEFNWNLRIYEDGVDTGVVLNGNPQSHSTYNVNHQCTVRFVSLQDNTVVAESTIIDTRVIHVDNRLVISPEIDDEGHWDTNMWETNWADSNEKTSAVAKNGKAKFYLRLYTKEGLVSGAPIKVQDDNGIYVSTIETGGLITIDKPGTYYLVHSETNLIVKLTIKPSAPIAVDSISVEDCEVKVSETITPNVTILPAGASDRSYTLSVEDPSKATVIGTQIVGISPGETVLTVKSSNNKTGTSKLTIKE